MLTTMVGTVAVGNGADGGEAGGGLMRHINAPPPASGAGPGTSPNTVGAVIKSFNVGLINVVSPTPGAVGAPVGAMVLAMVGGDEDPTGAGSRDASSTRRGTFESDGAGTGTLEALGDAELSWMGGFEPLSRGLMDRHSGTFVCGDLLFQAAFALSVAVGIIVTASSILKAGILFVSPPVNDVCWAGVGGEVSTFAPPVRDCCVGVGTAVEGTGVGIAVVG